MGSVVVFGSINRDLVVRVAHPPRPGETVLGQAFSAFPGGKGANQAVAAARMGVPTRLVGAIGRDENGAAMRAFLAGEGIGLSALLTSPDEPTGIALITVDAGGENSIIVVSGANQAVLASALPTLGPDDVLIAQFEVPLDQVLASFAAAHGAGARTVLNPAPFAPVESALLEQTDYLILNETELAGILGVVDIPDAVAAEAGIAMLRARPGLSRLTIIATLGGEGCLAIGPEGRSRLPGHPVKAVDTTGAGDCFCGSFAAGLSEGMTLEEALARANRAAAFSVTQAGAANSMPHRGDL